MNTLLEYTLKEYEDLKILSEKYPDLELLKDGTLISRSSAKKCNLFDIEKYCNYQYLKIFFIENNKHILVHELIDISRNGLNNLVIKLTEWGVEDKLIIKILTTINQNILKECY